MRRLITISLIFMFFVAGTAETRVGGILTRDARWNAKDNPFILEKDLVVSRYIRLIISPGVKVIIKPVPLQDTSIAQIDDIDKISVSIKVKGILNCLGKRENRISFTPERITTSGYGWYGIVFDNTDEKGNILSNTDLVGAYTAVTANTSSPIIHNCTIEYNHIGIWFDGFGKAAVTNSIIAYNMVTGIRVNNANPSIYNSIIIGNRNNGIWGDGNSRITLEHNCFFANADGNFLDCNPELGLLSKKNSNGDSTDFGSNIFADPTFAGSPADSLAAERDVTTATDRSKVKSSVVADIISAFQPVPASNKKPDQNTTRYTLSKYSPCINAGKSTDAMKDMDGTLNDIGIYGGPEFLKD